MKTAEEIRDVILAFAKQRQTGISFVELVEAVGEEDAKGDLEWYLEDKNFSNCLLWAGISQRFIDGMRMARPHLEIHPAHILVYFCDGRVPRLPIAKSAKHYKTPHWIPAVFSWREVPVAKGTPGERWVCE